MDLKTSIFVFAVFGNWFLDPGYFLSHAFCRIIAHFQTIPCPNPCTGNTFRTLRYKKQYYNLTLHFPNIVFFIFLLQTDYLCAPGRNYFCMYSKMTGTNEIQARCTNLCELKSTSLLLHEWSLHICTTCTKVHSSYCDEFLRNKSAKSNYDYPVYT